MYRERIINAGLALLAATTMACSIRENRSATPAAKPGPTIPVSTPESITTDCSKKGELMGLKPDIEGALLNSDKRIIATARIYLLRDDKRPDEGTYSLAAEPGELLAGPILALGKDRFPVSIGVESISENEAAVTGIIAPNYQVTSRFRVPFEINPRICNVVKANWKNWRFLAISVNDQSLTHDEFRRQQSLLKI